MTCKYDEWWKWPWTAHEQGVKYSGPHGLEVYYNARVLWLHYNKSCECGLCKSHKNTDERLRALRDTDRKLAEITAIKAAQASCLQGANEHIQWINNNKEQLLSAWIADTGIAPQDSVMVMQEHWEGPKMIRRVWIEKKTNE